MLFTIIKGLSVGIVASIPVGPIAIYVMQKSMSNGWKAGMQAAGGCVFLDFLMAILSVSAYGVISKFIEQNSGMIELIGGAIIIAVGIAMVFSNPQKPTAVPVKRSKKRIALDMSKSFVMGASNPGAFAWMLALYGAFQMDVNDTTFPHRAAIVLSITAGSFLYWLFFSWVAAKGNQKLQVSTLLKINHVSGVFVGLFGVYLLVIGILAL